VRVEEAMTEAMRAVLPTAEVVRAEAMTVDALEAVVLSV